MKHPPSPANGPDTAELELLRRRALDHLQSAIWAIGELTAAAPFPDRPRYTSVVGELSTIIQKFTEIGGAP